MHKSKHAPWLIGFASIVGMIALSLSAKAVSTSGWGHPNMVTFESNPSFNTLIVQMNVSGTFTNFTAMTPLPNTCSADTPSIEGIKAWQNLAEAAFLSGKQIKINWNDCNNGALKVIKSISLGD